MSTTGGPSHPRSSRRRYRRFVEDYTQGTLDDTIEKSDERRLAESADSAHAAASADSAEGKRGKRREYLREYLRWLWRIATPLVWSWSLRC